MQHALDIYLHWPG